MNKQAPSCRVPSTAAGERRVGSLYEHSIPTLTTLEQVGYKPHGGLRPFHQKSTCLTHSTCGANVVTLTPFLQGTQHGGRRAADRVAGVFQRCCAREGGASTPITETQNSRSETRNLEPETRNSKPETRNSKPKTRNPSFTQVISPLGIRHK